MMDDAEFSRIDRDLFERLHRGALDPIAFHLRDGRTLRGEVVEIRRFGAAGNVVGALAGEIRLVCDVGEISVPYSQIDHVT
jgi:hypothetical protein